MGKSSCMRFFFSFWRVYVRATNIYNDNETCHAALGIQALQRVNNLYSLGGLDLLCQVNLVSEWKLVSSSHLTHISLMCFICIIENRKQHKM